MSDLPPGYGSKQSEPASKLVRRAEEWRALRQGTRGDLSVFIPIYLVWGLVVAAVVGAATRRREGSHRRWFRLMESPLTLCGTVFAIALADAIETVFFGMSLSRLIDGNGASSIDSLVPVTQVFTGLKFGAAVIALLLLLLQLFGRPASMLLGLRREIGRAHSELNRLRELDRPRVPVPVAVVGSVVVAALGNGVVLLGRRWSEREWTTLIGVPLIGALGAVLLVRRGWGRDDLGLRWPKLEPRTQASQWLFRLAAILAASSAVLALVVRDHVTPLDIGRLLIGTAIGEEVVHRGVVLGTWAATRLKTIWIVVANMVTFALWHVAGADHETGFKWFEVIGPAFLALPLVWARLRFRSVLAPAALHGAANMTGTLTEANPCRR